MLRLRCGKIPATIHTIPLVCLGLAHSLHCLSQSRISGSRSLARQTAAVKALSFSFSALYVLNLQTSPPQGGERVLRAAYEKDPGDSVPGCDFVVIARRGRPLVSLRIPKHPRYGC